MNGVEVQMSAMMIVISSPELVVNGSLLRPS